ncbi:MAG: class 1 fructose-bisphosphatase [Halobacteria archaeon]
MSSEKTVETVIDAVTEAAPEIQAGLPGKRDYVEEDNPSGEDVLEADVWANGILRERITEIEGVGGYASEEDEEVTDCGDGYSVTVDPLDGSSNIPSNNIVGTILGIYDGSLPAKGNELVTSLYVVYGPLTSMVVADDDTVDIYVVTEEGRHLAEEDISIPDPSVYGFGGRRPKWTEGFREFAKVIEDELKLRYGGSMVGDVNQVINYGGIFSYPALSDRPEGKLRMQFEANPMAYIFENAGGASSDGKQSLLDAGAEELHQRTPVHLGNEELIEKLEKIL